MIRVRASQVFCNAMEDAVSAKKQLDEGLPFEQVAKKWSSCPSKENGGDLGWMPDGSVQSLLGETIDEKAKGKILGPVHTQYGYHILMITDIEVERVEGSVSTETRMNDLNDMFPEAHTLLFKTFHIGLPVSGYKAEDTVGSVCETNGKNPLEIVNFINTELSNRQIPTVLPEELRDKMQALGSPPTLLDIRESWEWDIAKIEAAQLVSRENNEAIINSLKKDQEIVLIDWKQDRSPSFQKWLAQRGFSNVKCLEGGIDAWAEKIETRLNRYDIDEDDGYRYEDIISEEGTP